ncbi:unnamed protein product, partial [marine sediment metagenome]
EKGYYSYISANLIEGEQYDLNTSVKFPWNSSGEYAALSYPTGMSYTDAKKV